MLTYLVHIPISCYIPFTPGSSPPRQTQSPLVLTLKYEERTQMNALPSMDKNVEYNIDLSDHVCGDDKNVDVR